MEQEKNQEELDKVQENILKMYYETLSKIRGYKTLGKEQKKEAQKYFKELRTQVIDTTKSIITQLDGIK